MDFTKRLFTTCATLFMTLASPLSADTIKIDFEDGTWNCDKQDIVYSTVGGPGKDCGIDVTQKFVREGKFAARFWRGPGEKRMEHGYRGINTYINGNHKFYRVSYYFDPAAEPDSQIIGTMFQLKHHGKPLDNAKCFAINAKKEGDKYAIDLDVRHYSDKQQCIRKKVPLFKSIPRGKWIDIIVETKWSNQADGWYKVFVRLEGNEDWKLMFEQNDIATLANPVDRNDGDLGEVIGYFKVGTYGGKAIKSNSEVYIDDVRICDRFAEASE